MPADRLQLAGGHLVYGRATARSHTDGADLLSPFRDQDYQRQLNS